MQCGQHTDAYWDMKNSSTMSIPKCNGQPCVISQSYSEGSSWKAIKVRVSCSCSELLLPLHLLLPRPAMPFGRSCHRRCGFPHE